MGLVFFLQGEPSMSEIGMLKLRDEVKYYQLQRLNGWFCVEANYNKCPMAGPGIGGVGHLNQTPSID